MEDNLKPPESPSWPARLSRLVFDIVPRPMWSARMAPVCAAPLACPHHLTTMARYLLLPTTNTTSCLLSTASPITIPLTPYILPYYYALTIHGARLPHHRAEQEGHAFPLVRPQLGSQPRVDAHDAAPRPRPEGQRARRIDDNGRQRRGYCL